MFGKKPFDDVSNSPETRLPIWAHAGVDMLPSPRRRTTRLNDPFDPPLPHLGQKEEYMRFLSCVEKQETGVCELSKPFWHAKLKATEDGMLCLTAVLHM